MIDLIDIIALADFKGQKNELSFDVYEELYTPIKEYYNNNKEGWLMAMKLGKTEQGVVPRDFFDIKMANGSKLAWARFYGQDAPADTTGMTLTYS